MQANTRDLAKWHVDHAAQAQPVLVRLAGFRVGEALCGHVTSEHLYARSLASIEAIIGQFFAAILLTRLAMLAVLSGECPPAVSASHCRRSARTSDSAPSRLLMIQNNIRLRA